MISNQPSSSTPTRLSVNSVMEPLLLERRSNGYTDTPNASLGTEDYVKGVVKSEG